MLKKSIAILSALLCSSFMLLAKKPAAKQTENNKSLLWEISGNRLKQKSYLFGTIHMICKADYVWTSNMNEALKASDKVVLELDMDDPVITTAVNSSMMTEDGKTLKDYFSTEDYAKLEIAAKAQQLPLPMLQQFKPIALMSLLYTKALTCPIPSSYEMNLVELAKAQQKEVLGIESPEEQMSVLEGMNNDSTASAIVKYISSIDSFKMMFGALLNSYKNQDLPELYKLIVSSPEMADDLNGLLYERNKRWIPRMKILMEAQPCFFAVGAGHLWGNDGVIDLLHKAGYTVKPIHDKEQ